MKSKIPAVAAVLTVGLAAAACGSSDTPTAAAAGGAASSAGGAPTTLNIAYVPYNGNAPMFLGVKQGLYAKEGLELKMTPAQAPAAAIAGLVSGQQQLAFTTVVTLVTARSQGTDVKCVTPVDGVVDDAEKALSTATMVKGDSSVQDAAGLAGKKVGVVALGSQNHLFTLEKAAQAGIDPKSVQVVQLPFPQMQAALEQGRVDAVVATAPFTGQIQAAGGRVLNWPEAELNKGGNGTCFAATDKYLASNAADIEKFVTANAAAIDYAKAHEDEARAVIPTFLEVTPEQAKTAVTGVVYDPTLNTASIDKFQQLMLKHGFIKQALPLDQLVHQP